MNRPLHVSLRDVTEGDLPTFFLDQLDPDAGRMAALPARNRNAFHSHWARILADAEVAKKTIIFGGDVAGNVVSWRQDGRRLVGYWIGKGYWGRGVATAALSEFLKELDERPLNAHVAAHNIGSIRVLQKCGFEGPDEEEARLADKGLVEEVCLMLPT